MGFYVDSSPLGGRAADAKSHHNMASGLEWQSTHGRRLSVLARAHQGDLGVLYDQGGVRLPKKEVE